MRERNRFERELQDIGIDREVSSFEKTQWIQTFLNASGERLKVDGIFGSNTREAVKRFQSRYGLQSDGIVGPITETALIQRALNVIAKKDKLKVNGIKDSKTSAEIMNFQSTRKLMADGIVGPQTRAAMIAALVPTTQPWKPPTTTQPPIAPPLTVDPTLAPTDPISLTGSGLSRTMAEIYNKYGKYLKEKSQKLGISPASAAAVLKVESPRGSGFDSNGRMIIRFENHIFYDKWGKYNEKVFNDHFKFAPLPKRFEGHKFRRSTDVEFTDCHVDQNKEWEVFEFGRRLDETAAISSISMGAAQIMGFNFSLVGYNSPKEMFDNMSKSILAQLEGFFMFILAHSECINGLRTNDYVRFALCYNGKGQEQDYGTWIREAKIHITV